MLENRFHTTVTIKVPNGTYLDGKPQFDEYTGEAFETAATELDLKEPVGMSVDRVFLVRCPVEIVPGSIIISEGAEFRIENVRKCRRLNGADFCYRCQTTK
jgi:hypothetical protein